MRVKDAGCRMLDVASLIEDRARRPDLRHPAFGLRHRPGVAQYGEVMSRTPGFTCTVVWPAMVVLLPRLRRSCTRYMPCVSNVWLVVQRRLTVLLPSSYGSQFSVASDLVPSPQSHSISGQ